MADEITRGVMTVTLNELDGLIRQAKTAAFEAVIAKLWERAAEESRLYGSPSSGLMTAIQVATKTREEDETNG